MLVNPILLFGRAEGRKQDVRLCAGDCIGGLFQPVRTLLEAKGRTVGSARQGWVVALQGRGRELRGTRPATQ